MKELSQFVESLFENGKESGKKGIHVRLDDNSVCTVLIESDGEKYVTVKMNGTVMGKFEKLESLDKGYKYRFIQEYRVGIRLGLTTYEQLMLSICGGNHLILIQKANP